MGNSARDSSDFERTVTIESVQIEFIDADANKMTKNFTIEVGDRVTLTVKEAVQ